MLLICKLERPVAMSPKFITAGFDIRVWPARRFPTTDATEWPQHEDAYQRALEVVSENSLQLLEPMNNDELDEVLAIAARASEAATVIAIALLETTLATVVPPFVPLRISIGTEWETLGIDVCDLNGLFSALNMKVASGDPLPLFAEADLINAFALSEMANVKIPAHRPFVLARLSRFVKR